MYARKLRSAGLKTNAIIEKERDNVKSDTINSAKRSKSLRKLKSANVKKYPLGDRNETTYSKSGSQILENKVPDGTGRSVVEGEKLLLWKEQNVKYAKRIRKNDSSLSAGQVALTDLIQTHTVSERLRPRRKLKNYCEESILIKKHIPLQKRNSIVLLENINELGERKIPIYKSVRISEEFVKDRNEIYDFKFDVDDYKERLATKKRNKIVRKPTMKKVMKGVTRNPILQRKGNKANSVESNVLNKVQKGINKVQIHIDRTNGCLKDGIVTESNCNTCEAKQSDTTEARMEASTSPLLRMPLTDNTQNIQKPKVMSVKIPKENKFNVASATKIITRDSKPAQVINSFNLQYMVQHKDTVNQSLFNKSLSPINNISATFDSGSPWRPPTLNVFSKVGHVYQSTPREQQQTSASRKTMPVSANKTMSILKAEKGNISEENENTNIQVAKVVNNSKEEGFAMKPSRIFGTEISNMKHPKLFQTNLNSSTNDNLLSIDHQTVKGMSKLLSNTQNISTYNETVEDKENTRPKSQTSKDSLKRSKQINISSHIDSLEKELSEPILNPIDSQNKDFKLQTDSSSFQKHDSIRTSTILKQLNLDNFLKVDKMPQRSEMYRTHDIFNETYLTPIDSMPIRKIQKETDIQNAFGFNDKCSDDEISLSVLPDNSTTLSKKVFNKPMENIKNFQEQKVKKFPSKPVRLLIDKVKTTETFDRNVQVDERKENEEELFKDKGQEVADSVSFSDTFDIISENRESNDKEIPSELPLFVDLQPVHFTKPPRFSYHGKRSFRHCFSEDEDVKVEEGETHIKPKIKKKRVGHLNKVEEERLKEWVKSINETFQEIDQHNLVIE